MVAIDKQIDDLMKQVEDLKKLGIKDYSLR